MAKAFIDCTNDPTLPAWSYQYTVDGGIYPISVQGHLRALNMSHAETILRTRNEGNNKSISNVKILPSWMINNHSTLDKSY